MRTLGIIPARGGSKGIPGKNLRPFFGRPLIWWTIAAARKSLHLDCVVISTDCPEIRSACRSWGEHVIERPPELATDTSPVIDTVRHVLTLETWKPDAVMLLQPTNPLRTPEDIDAAIEVLTAFRKADSVLSVVEVGEWHPYRMRVMDGSKTKPLVEAAEVRRQDLPSVYLRDGSIYLARLEVVENGRFEGNHCLPLAIPAERSCRLDTEWDWRIGEIKADQLLTPTV